MPRPVRVHLGDALYYITSRAAEGSVLFKDDDDYRAYLELLRAVRAQEGFKLFVFLLEADRLHLLVQPGTATVSDIMQGLNSRYTKYVAKRHGRTSHVFQDRFRSTLIEKAPSLLPVTAVLHRLPCAHEGAASDARTSPWSSFASYRAGGPAVDGLDLRNEAAEVAARLQSEHPGRTYESYAASLSQDEIARWTIALQERVVGSAAFIRLVTERAQMAKHAAPRIEAQLAATAARPAAERRGWVPAALAATAVLAVTLGAAGLYARTAAQLQRTLAAMAQSKPAPIAIYSVAPEASRLGARPASFTQPFSLSGTSWQVHIRPSGSSSDSVAQTDDLRFDAGRMVSSMLSGQGFSDTNYTLTSRGDGTMVWETMQTGPNGEVVCWRGETDGFSVRGLLTRQTPNQPASAFAFVGAVRTGAQET